MHVITLYYYLIKYFISLPRIINSTHYSPAPSMPSPQNKNHMLQIHMKLGVIKHDCLLYYLLSRMLLREKKKKKLLYFIISVVCLRGWKLMMHVIQLWTVLYLWFLFTCFPREQSVAWPQESSMDVMPEASQFNPHSHLGEGNKQPSLGLKVEVVFSVGLLFPSISAESCCRQRCSRSLLFSVRTGIPD